VLSRPKRLLRFGAGPGASCVWCRFGVEACPSAGVFLRVSRDGLGLRHSVSMLPLAAVGTVRRPAARMQQTVGWEQLCRVRQVLSSVCWLDGVVYLLACLYVCCAAGRATCCSCCVVRPACVWLHVKVPAVLGVCGVWCVRAEDAKHCVWVCAEGRLWQEKDRTRAYARRRRCVTLLSCA
jgi:hypothetical protein